MVVRSNKYDLSSFQEMIDDWSSKYAPDLLFYVPYTWKFEFILKEFELITLANEFNWIDTSSTNTENTHLAICGNLLNVKFDLPYTEFLPQIIPFHFEISFCIVRNLSTGKILNIRSYLIHFVEMFPTCRHT